MLHDISWKQSPEIPCLNGTRAWHWNILRQCSPLYTLFCCLVSCNLTFPPPLSPFSPKWSFLCLLPNEILYTVFTPHPPLHATHPSQVILFDLVSLILTPKQNKLWTLSSCHFLLNHIVFSKLFILAQLAIFWSIIIIKFIFMYLFIMLVSLTIQNTAGFCK